MSAPAPLLTPESVPRLPRGVRLRHDQTRDEWLLMGPERLLKLDSIAREILQRCDGERSVAAIVAELAARFGAEAATVERDVRAFLEALLARGLLSLE